MRLLLLTVCTTAVLVVGPRSPDLLATAAGPTTPFPQALGAALALVLVAVALWALLVVGLSALGSTGTRLATAMTPRLLRGTLLVATSAALSATPAVAGESLDGLRLPERVTSESRDAVPPVAVEPRHDAPPDHRTPQVATVEVHRGDSLWGLVRARLGDADPGRVAHEVRRWHTANRTTIGDDPDLLRPGQRLQVPEGLR